MAATSASRPRRALRFFLVIFLTGTVFFPLLTFFFITHNVDTNVLPTPISLHHPVQPSDLQDKIRGAIIGLKENLEADCSSCADHCVRSSSRSARQEEVERTIQMLETQERSAAFEKIFVTDIWGGGESRSGTGSRIDYTANVRLLIAQALKDFEVHHLLDAPCGDVNWQPLIDGFNATKYTGYDIVPQIIEKNMARCTDRPKMNFSHIDFVNMPITLKPDLIVSCDGIQHNSLKDGVQGFSNLENTGAKYLITNWHTETGRGFVIDNDINMNIAFGRAYPINVFTHPFNFSNPEYIISEGANGQNSDGKLAGL